ncbi:hypothetical protein [Arthrobacter sp. NicSoilC5]|uniref:hypothetical protein n=1 Tax=Arthrobacter sp. NicSoilC5 TaxID=2831000 RepID=UPI001CC4AD8B|nr:hypothetical protein [Arthrobacter sp. NicSoilC5]BCW78311.1 hypothetical protein NicSoilC5_03300 [Arthrobacter sp. NicSoilC5]
MDFNPDTWGTVADWVGGLGTTAAFVATAIVINRDAKVRKLSQARKVVYITEEFGIPASTDADGNVSFDMSTRYIVQNLSEEPIYDIRLYARHQDGSRRWLAAEYDILLPEKAFTLNAQFDEAPLVTFRDNSGARWIRDKGGRVLPRHRLLFAVADSG